jgi:hypothetical protein
MLTLPGSAPVTMPLEEPTEAMSGATLDQVPPVMELLNAVVTPEQTMSVPEMTAAGLTDTVVVETQPAGVR